MVSGRSPVTHCDTDRLGNALVHNQRGRATNVVQEAIILLVRRTGTLKTVPRLPEVFPLDSIETSSQGRYISMPVFMMERQYSDQFEASAALADRINRINDDVGVQWLYSFLSKDKRKTYCLYGAPSAEAIQQAAYRAGLPADVIIEIADRISPDGSLSPL
jgi:hypothetical protein